MVVSLGMRRLPRLFSVWHKAKTLWRRMAVAGLLLGTSVLGTPEAPRLPRPTKPAPVVLHPSTRVSFYGSPSDGLLGRRMASGVRLGAQMLVAAHRTLPFGTELLVENLQTGSSVIVRVMDRGPFVRGRSLDLSIAAAKQLRITSKGVVRVRISIINQ